MTPAPISGFELNGNILRWTEPEEYDEVQIEISCATGAPFFQVYDGAARVCHKDLTNYIPPAATVLYAKGRGKKGGGWGGYTNPPAQFTL